MLVPIMGIDDGRDDSRKVACVLSVDHFEQYVAVGLDTRFRVLVIKVALRKLEALHRWPNSERNAQPCRQDGVRGTGHSLSLIHI